MCANARRCLHEVFHKSAIFAIDAINKRTFTPIPQIEDLIDLGRVREAGYVKRQVPRVVCSFVQPLTVK